jgi:large subunit ribosomal protein L13
MFVKRTIRGMLPFRKARGKGAFKKIKCHVGVPEGLRSDRIIRLDSTSEKIILTDHFKVKDICRAIGGK